MAQNDFSYLYPYSAEEAQRRNELEQWRQSHKMNMACRDAIVSAINRGFDGRYLDKDCAQTVISAYGYKRTGFVLVKTLSQLSHDGRFSRDNKAWAKGTYIPSDGTHNQELVVTSHPAVLDGFINQFRKAYADLNLFAPQHCEAGGSTLDYEGRVLVMRPGILHESYWEPKYQLWYAHDGFGCSPTAVGRSIRCTCLGDGEMTRWNRADFIGPIKEELLPDWAKEQVEQLRTGQQIAEACDCPGPEMKL